MTMTSQPQLLMWIDPGLDTGWAVWRPDTSYFSSGNVHGVIDAGRCIRSQLSSSHDAAIGCEGFTIRPGSSKLKLDTTALEVIGVARWLACQTGARLLPLTQPDSRKLGQLHLKTVGWHRPGPDHADSAASHLLSYLLQERQLPADLLAKITRKQEEEA